MRRLQNAEGYFKAARDIQKSTDISSIVDSTNLDRYQKEVDERGKRYENGELSTAGLLWEDLKGIVSNPLAQAELATDNAADYAAALFGGPIGLGIAAGSSFGEARMAINEGRELHKKKNQGALPDRSTQRKQELAGLGSAIADFAGDVAVAGAVKGFNKVLGQPNTKNAEETLKKGILAAAGRVGKATAVAGIASYRQKLPKPISRMKLP